MTQVQFDYDGALRLARDLHATAQRLELLLTERDHRATTALRSWRGPHGDVFRARATTEDQEARSVVGALTVEALDWAQAWADAINEQNRRNRERRVQELSDARAIGERLVDLAVGDDSDQQVADLRYISVPRAPDFVPTGSLQRF